MVLNSEPGGVRTGQRKVRGSSWLTEAASYGVEPVPNRFRRLMKNPKFGQKVSKPFITNQQQSCVTFITTPKQYNLHIKGNKR